jgi:hypothetical protein
MLRRRPRRTPFAWLWQPTAGWLLLAFLYLTAAVLSMLLALAMSAWEPLLLVAALVAAAIGCLLAALDN